MSIPPPTPPPSPPAGGTSAQALSRFNWQAAQQGNQAATNLALLEAENTQAAGSGGTAAAAQAAHPATQRLSTNQWAGMTGQVNHAQAAQDVSTAGQVWVTVPVDKVQTTPGGGQAAAPVYATSQGYKSKPGESTGSIPPPHASAVGRPF